MASSVTAISPDEFESLFAPHRDAVRAYVHRMIGHPGEAEDLIQDVSLKAFEKRGSLRSTASFRSWLFRIAATTCLDFLRKQARWRPFSQSHVEHECAQSEVLRQEVVDTTRDPEFAFDVYEHMAFCFTCVGRSLPPEQQAAIILREVVGFNNREAAQILGLSEPQLRHRLASGRQAMQDTYEGLCALVGKQGICHQCAGFRNATARARRGPSLPVLQDAPDPWAERIRAVRHKEFVGGVSQSLHDLIFERIRRLEG